jgi:hypothetical protein
VTAFLSRTESRAALRSLRRVTISPAQNAELARLLYMSWQLPDGPKSLLGVRAALGQRLIRIGTVGRQIAEGEHADLSAYRSELHLPFLEGVSSAIDAWESIFGMAEEHWALLFDELELAPPEIKRELFLCLRSRDDRLLFKLALAPFAGDESFAPRAEAAQPDQDFDTVSLWFTDKRSTLPFCRQLWEGMLKAQNLPATQPRAAFGRSRFDTAAGEWKDQESGTAYGPGTRWQRRFAQLEAIDPSFKAYLQERGYESHRLDKIPPASRAAEIRKISPLVEARLFFLRDKSQSLKGASRERGRKRLTLYAGWETLCAVSEGNPRWFIGMVKRLLDEAEGATLRIPQRSQARAIEDTAERYRAALRTIPVTSSLARSKSTGLVALLDSLGEYFRERQILGPFTPEPPGSFTLDRNAPSDTVDAVGQALNAGALVFVEDNEDATALVDLRGRRFRLCYLLAAYHEAMPRLGRAVSLRRILSETKFDTRDPIQLTLT